MLDLLMIILLAAGSAGAFLYVRACVGLVEANGEQGHRKKRSA